MKALETKCDRCGEVLKWTPSAPQVFIPPGWVEVRELGGGTRRYANRMVCRSCAGLLAKFWLPWALVVDPKETPAQ
jgi:hypothetical protein